jgi:hypothetical protein
LGQKSPLKIKKTPKILYFEKKLLRELHGIHLEGQEDQVGILNVQFLLMNYFRDKLLISMVVAMIYYFLTTKTKEFNT